MLCFLELILIYGCEFKNAQVSDIDEKLTDYLGDKKCRNLDQGDRVLGKTEVMKKKAIIISPHLLNLK